MKSILLGLLLLLISCGSIKRMSEQNYSKDMLTSYSVFDSIAKKRIQNMYRELLHDYTIHRVEVVYDTTVSLDKKTGKRPVLRKILTEMTGNIRKHEQNRDSMNIELREVQKHDNINSVREHEVATKERKSTGQIWWLVGLVVTILFICRIYKFFK